MQFWVHRLDSQVVCEEILLGWLWSSNELSGVSDQIGVGSKAMMLQSLE